MRSICFFCSYYTSNTLPAYVRFYLLELKRHFTEVVLVTNEKEMIAGDVAFCKNNNITLKLVINDGFDFGMYYKMFKEYDVRNYDRVGLVNDSCILFRKLDSFFQWIDEEKPDYCGLTDSNEFTYHLQSYFIVINKKAIPLVAAYFDEMGIINDFLELINVYEIGLCSYLINKGMKISAYYPVKKDEYVNPSWMKIKKLIREGFPLIKKRIISQDYRMVDWKKLVKAGFDPFPRHYIKLIKKATGDSYTDIFSELTMRSNSWSKFLFTIRYVFDRIDGFWVIIKYWIKRILFKVNIKQQV